MSPHSPVLVKYGKASGPLLSHKQSYLTDNERIIAEHRQICELYTAQPPRTTCKNCTEKLGIADFVKQGIPYAVCPKCGHLNGLHEDTVEFCQAVYAEDGGKDYAKHYAAADREAYECRVEDIYVPKAEFLAEVMNKAGVNQDGLKVADFGAGSGYMVNAMRRVGFENAIGYEVSESQVDLGNHMLGSEALNLHNIEETVAIAETTDAKIVTMIGVLEHLIHPRDVLTAIAKNPSVEYVMISVPLFSTCIFFEMVFETVMHRQLTAGHTHLYTEQSIDHLCQEFGLRRLGEWWFGTDIVDLYRSVAVKLGQNEQTKNMAQNWVDSFVQVIDGLQLQLDQKHLSSEVHLVLQK